VTAKGTSTSRRSIACSRLTPEGLSRIAGNARAGYSGDGGQATNAQLATSYTIDQPGGGLALDSSGNLFIADNGNGVVRRVSSSGAITTVAGNGTNGYSGDGGPATNAQLFAPTSLAVDGSGSLYIADYFNDRIRKVSAAGVITTVAGNGTSGYSGDGGPATSAELGLYGIDGIAVDASGNLFIADSNNGRVRMVAPSGIITTVAGGGTGGDGGPATNAQLNAPSVVAVDASGNLYIAEAYRIRKVSASGIITTIAGNGSAGFSGDAGPSVNSQLNYVTGLNFDASGSLSISDHFDSRIRKISASGIISTIAGIGICCGYIDSGAASAAQLFSPLGIALDAAGNLYISADDISQQGINRVRKISTSGIITTVAGGGNVYPGDGGSTTSAELISPIGVAADAKGNLYIADDIGNRVRKVSPNGSISTVAGDGSNQLQPFGLATDAAGNLYISDPSATRISKVSSSGVITTVAGTGTPGFSGDNGPATSAQLSGPGFLAVDSAGNLYMVDGLRVRMVSTNGIITTIAGSGAQQYFGDGGLAINAGMAPSGVAVDSAGSIYITDHNRVRKIQNGIITTIAGNGSGGYSGDGGPAASASLGGPASLAVDSTGNVYVADVGNSAIRLLSPTSAPVLISAVVDAASEMAGPLSPGKIVTIYGGGLGPSTLTQFQLNNGVIGTQLSGTTVSFNGIAAPIVYTSAAQVAAIVPYEVTGTTAQVAVSYQGQTSTAVTVPIAASAPSLFSLNETGAGQAAAINVVDGTVNTAANPVKIGTYISLFATGEGQTTPAGVDGKIASGPLLPAPNLKVSVTVGGIPAVVQYAGAAPGEVAGVMQVNVQIPVGVQPGGYVPVVLQVGSAATAIGAAWIAVAGN